MISVRANPTFYIPTREHICRRAVFELTHTREEAALQVKHFKRRRSALNRQDYSSFIYRRAEISFIAMFFHVRACRASARDLIQILVYW